MTRKKDEKPKKTIDEALEELKKEAEQQIKDGKVKIILKGKQRRQVEDIEQPE